MTTYTDADGVSRNAGEQVAHDQALANGDYLQAEPEQFYEAAPAPPEPVYQPEPVDYGLEPELYDEQPQGIDLLGDPAQVEGQIRDLIREETGLGGYGYEDPEALAAQAQYQYEQEQAQATLDAAHEEQFRGEDWPAYVAAAANIPESAAGYVADDAFTASEEVAKQLLARLQADGMSRADAMQTMIDSGLAAEAIRAGTGLARQEFGTRQIIREAAGAAFPRSRR